MHKRKILPISKISLGNKKISNSLDHTTQLFLQLKQLQTLTIEV